VLLAQSGHYISRGDVARGHAQRVEPDAHGVLALAEDKDVAHALYALERVFDIDIDVVAEEEAVVAIVVRVNAGGKDKILGGLVDGDAVLVHFARQASLNIGHAVLHIDRSEIYVAVLLKDDVHAAGAIVAAGRGDVLHALDAVDLLLQRISDRGLDGLG